MLTIKEDIEAVLKSIDRPGMDKVIAYLAGSDFYTAPASAVTRFHNAFVGGLADHSWKVYQTMLQMNEMLPAEKKFDPQSIAMVGLLHDICKVDVYEPNILRTTGRPSDSKPFVYKDKFAFGHGEKSVFVLMRIGLDAPEEVFLAIRWHMNAYDQIPYSKCADSWNDLSILAFLADYFASRFLEKREADK